MFQRAPQAQLFRYSCGLLWVPVSPNKKDELTAVVHVEGGELEQSGEERPEREQRRERSLPQPRPAQPHPTRRRPRASYCRPHVALDAGVIGKASKAKTTAEI